MAPYAFTTLGGLALAAVLTTGCDVRQSMPETGSTLAVPMPALSTPGPGAAAGTVQAPAVAPPGDAAEAVGERSIRLFGRGVSRQRQIRV